MSTLVGTASPAVLASVVAVQRPTGPEGSPGFLGFVVTFAVAVVVVVLVLAMTSSLRRAKFRGDAATPQGDAHPEPHVPRRRAVPREDDRDGGAGEPGPPGPPGPPGTGPAAP